MESGFFVCIIREVSMNNSFVMYKTFYDQIKHLEDSLRLKFMDAIMAYGIEGIEPEFSGLELSVWIPIKNDIDNAKKRYDNSIETGKKGGRPEKLSQEDKEEIVTENQNGTTQEHLAEKYEVSQSTISGIINNYQNIKKGVSDINNIKNIRNLDVDVDVDVDVDDDVDVVVDEAEVSDNDLSTGYPQPPQHDTTFSPPGIKKICVSHGVWLTDRQYEAMTMPEEIREDEQESFVAFLLEETERKYKDKSPVDVVKLKVSALTKYPQDFVAMFLEKNSREKDEKLKKDFKNIYKKPPYRNCRICRKELSPISDYDEKSNIAYMSYTCNECGKILECSNGVWKEYDTVKTA